MLSAASAAHLALGAAFTWGVLIIPLVIGYIGRQGTVTTRRSVTLSITFAIGILMTIAAVCGVTAAAGRLIGDVGRIGNFVMAGVFILVGQASVRRSRDLWRWISNLSGHLTGQRRNDEDRDLGHRVPEVQCDNGERREGRHRSRDPG